MARPVLLDMDPGVDDALALLLALRSPELDVCAITICAGNVAAERGALNALKTLDVASSKAVPVAVGATRPLRREPIPGSHVVHGVDGLGDVRDKFPDPPTSRIDSAYGPELMVDAARRRPKGPSGEGLTVIATGPLTNVALAISLDPEAMRGVERIVWMGGSYGVPGNVTSVAEFNAFYDPDAAAEVLSSGIPVLAVGLNVTHLCAFTRTSLEELSQKSPGPVSGFSRAICQHYLRFHLAREGQDFCYLHDPLAVGLVVWPELLTHSELHSVTVVTERGTTQGMTIIDRRPRNPWLNPAARNALSQVPPASRELLTAFELLPPQPTTTIALDVLAQEFVRRLITRLEG